MSYFLGLDPGLGGAVALVDSEGGLVMVEDLPTEARGSGRVKRACDPVGIAHLIRTHARDIKHGIIELAGARPGQGVAGV